jgi:hypothetical protein
MSDLSDGRRALLLRGEERFEQVVTPVLGTYEEVRQRAPGASTDTSAIIAAIDDLRRKVEGLHALAPAHRTSEDAHERAEFWFHCGSKLSGCFIRQYLN